MNIKITFPKVFFICIFTFTKVFLLQMYRQISNLPVRTFKSAGTNLQVAADLQSAAMGIVAK